MTEHRKTRRYSADWVARYRFNKRTSWQDCRIVDLSRRGAALELPGVEPERLLGRRRVHLQIQSVLGVGRGAPILADIRHCGPTTNGLTAVGIEFHDLTDEQFRLLALVVGLRTVVV